MQGENHSFVEEEMNMSKQKNKLNMKMLKIDKSILWFAVVAGIAPY